MADLPTAAVRRWLNIVQPRRVRRHITVAMAVLTLLAQLPSPSLGLDPTASPGPSAEATEEGTGFRSDGALVVPAVAAPIELPAGGGRGGSGSAGVGLPAPAADVAVRGQQSGPALPAARAEVLAARTENTRTFANPDGTFDLELSSGRLHYLDEAGSWRPIDLRLVTTADPVFGLRVAANDRAVAFGTVTGEAGVARLTTDRGSVAVRAIDHGGASRAGSSIAYRPIDPGATVRAYPTDTGFGFVLRFDDAMGQPFVDLALDLDGIVAELGPDGRSFLLAEPGLHSEGTTEPGEIVGTISAPILLEGGEDGGPAADQSVLSVGLGAGPGGVPTIRYALDPVWLRDPARVFPVVVDPTVCLGQGASTCPLNYTSGNIDHWIDSYTPTTEPTGWNVIRVGWDVRTNDCCVFEKMRGLVYFADVPLPEDAVIFDTDLQLHISSEYGSPVGQTIYANRVTKGWGQSTTWSAWSSGAGYTETGRATDTVPSSGYMHWDTDAIVKSWYTRRPKDWTGDLGFALVMGNEGSATGEVEFDRYNDNTAAYRPLLTITYEQPAVEIDFDAALGENYAPARFRAGASTTLPLVIRNNSSFSLKSQGTDANAHYRVGYRFLDADGAVVASSSSTQLGGDIAAGATAALALPITPPATAGQYTLRLDLVRYHYGSLSWLGDWARPAYFYSRTKENGDPDNTDWTGSAAIERAEFKVNVATVIDGETHSVATGDGGALGIDLWTQGISYRAADDLGFADKLPLDLRYGYDSSAATGCDLNGYLGVIAACGWWTNWDERITGGPNQTGFDYVYQDPSGNRHLADTDRTGQIVSGAPVLIERPRLTLYDEDRPSANASVSLQLLTAESPYLAPHSGDYLLKMPSGSDQTLDAFTAIDVNTYRYLSFAAHTSAAAGLGVAVKVHVVPAYPDPETAPPADFWLVYVVGTDFSTPSYQKVALGGTVTGATWRTVTARDLYADIRAVPTNVRGTGAYDRYQVVSAKTVSNGTAGNAYLDAIRLEPALSTKIADTNPTWSSGQTLTGTSSDAVVGAASVYVRTATLASSPDCIATGGCWPSGGVSLWTSPFISWYWKKVGGQTAAVVVHVENVRTGEDRDLLYYAGPSAPPDLGSATAISVSDVTPVAWMKVTRNVLDDARQAFGWYVLPTTANPATPPPDAPSPDEVRLNGYRVSAVDGNFVLVDELRSSSLPAPASAAGTLTTDADFRVTYPDGTEHRFNEDGLLAGIRNRHGDEVEITWARDTSRSGQASYALEAIRSPTDGTTASGYEFVRRLEVTRSTGSPADTVTVTERLGTTTNPVTGRATIFAVASVPGIGTQTYAVGDLIRVDPARRDAACSTGARPSGCAEFSYTSAAADHRLAWLADPRWDGSTSGATDYRFEIAPVGATGVEIRDRSRSSTPILRVLSFDVGAASPAATRAIWQDAAAARADDVMAADLTSDGRVLAAHVPRSCTASDCDDPANWPTFSATTVGTEHRFNGLAQVAEVVTYRCPDVDVAGCVTTSAQKSVSRQATRAGARIDNYVDPLTGGELAWTQTEAQSFASLRDSAGDDPDLYRTTYAYNERGQRVAVAEPVHSARAEYAATVRTTAQLSFSLIGYWRLDEASGAAAADQSATPHAGTYQNFTGGQQGQAGALVGTSAGAAYFDGTNNHVAIPSGFGTITGSFSVTTWIRPDALGTTDRAFIGSRKGTTASTDYTFDAKLHYDSAADRHTLRVDIGNGSTWLRTADFAYPFEALRYYQVGIVVDDAADTVTAYVNGVQIGRQAFTTAGTPRLADTTRLLKIGNNGRDSSSPEWFAGRIDEVAVWALPLTPTQVGDQYLAGRAIAIRPLNTTYDLAWRPTQLDDQFLASPGFESGLADWDFGQGIGGTVFTTTTPGSGNVKSGFASFSTGLTGNAQQDTALVPGQTFRFQVHTKRTSGTIRARTSVYYYRLSTAEWATLVSTTTDAQSVGTWASYAWDFTLPLDTDGRVRVALWTQTGTGSETVYFDDAALVTAWSKTTYATSSGLPSQIETLPPTTTNAGSAGTVVTTVTYGAVTGASVATNAHPAIWPTTVIANDVASPVEPDEDVTTTSTFDGWGHRLVVTDADGIATTTTYRTAAGDGRYTDIVSTADGTGAMTTYAYDLVGRRTSSTSPLGRTATVSYDLRGHVTAEIGPDGATTTHAYDGTGFRTTTTSPDGTPTSYVYDVLGNLTSSDADNGGIDFRTAATYDLVGNRVTSTVYPDTAHSGGLARTTTERFETANGLTRLVPSGTIGPLAPPTSAPDCPGGGDCTEVRTLDLANQVTARRDVYGIETRIFHDLAGRVVIEVRNWSDGVFSAAAPDVDVVSVAQYTIAGGVTRSVDVLGRADLTAFDALGRPSTVTHYDAGGVAINETKAVYTKAGRIDLAADLADEQAADSARTWTKTLYDAAGRPTASLANYNTTGAAGLSIDGFETGSDAWSRLASGFFTTSDASTASTDTNAAGQVYRSTGPEAGRGRLRVVTNGAWSGAWWDLSSAPVPQTFKGGRTYTLRFDLLGPSGTSLRAFFGQDASGGDYREVDGDGGTGGTQPISADGAWHTYSVTWTPSADRASDVAFAVRKDSAGAVTFRLDNVIVADTTAGATYRNIPTETAYDADGQVIGAVLPPGDPATEDPLTSTTASDAAGRPVISTTNTLDRYASTVLGTGGLAGYWPLDERGTLVAEDVDGSLDLATAASTTLGIAGGVDEARTAYLFDASADLASTSSAATSATDGFSLEAWVRSDNAQSGSANIAAWNGDATDGWGIGTNSAGVAIALYLAGGVTTTLSTTDLTIDDGAWHHLVLVRSAGTSTLWVDGAARTLTNATATPGSPGAGFAIGAQAAGLRRFAGEVDEVAVYSSALSSGTIGTHYATGRRTEPDVALTTRTAADVMGRPIDTWDPTGTRTHHELDDLGRITATTLNHLDGTASGSAGDDDVRSTFAYDAAGELTAYCPARQVLAGCDPANDTAARAWHWTYDAWGNQADEQPPSGNLDATVWTYDAGNRLTTERRCSSTVCGSPHRVTTTVYDALGRPTQTTTANGGGVIAVRTTTDWFGDGAPKTARLLEGPVPTEVDAIDFAYDALGRLDTLKRSGVTQTDYAYNADGTIASRIDGPAGAIGTTTYAYDWADRLASVTAPSAWSAGGSLTFSYRADGLMAGRTWPNGESLTASYDEVRRPTSFGLSGAHSLSQAYDRDGNVTAESRSLGVAGDAGTGTQSFTYDALGRLVGASGLASGSQSYTYDLDGNRLTRTAGGSTYTATFTRTGQQATLAKDAGAPITFAYDTSGNLTSWSTDGATTTTAAYDLADRRTSLTPPGSPPTTTSFSTDALGRVRTRTTGSLAETMSYLGATETVLRVDPSTGSDRDGLTGPAGGRLATRTGTSLRHLLVDPHGNLTAAEGAGATTIVEAIRTDAWGVELDTYPAAPSGLADVGYGGRFDLAPAGADALYDFGARDYVPGLGAFASLDTYQGSITEPRSLHRFAYAWGNPASLIDPTGHVTINPDQLCPPGEDCSAEPTTDFVVEPRGGTSSPKGSGSGTTTDATTPSDDADDLCATYGECDATDDGFAFDPGIWDGRCLVSGSGLWYEPTCVKTWGQAYREELYGHGDLVSGLLVLGGLTVLVACIVVCVPLATAAVAGGAAAIEVYAATGSIVAACARINCQSKIAAALTVACEAAGGGCDGASGPAGPVQFRVPAWATADEVAHMERYVAAAERARLAGALSPSGRVSTSGLIAAEARFYAAGERARALVDGMPYVGVVGHAPDSTWVGSGVPFEWVDMSMRINSSLAGQSAQYPVGFIPTVFSLLSGGG